MSGEVSQNASWNPVGFWRGYSLDECPGCSLLLHAQSAAWKRLNATATFIIQRLVDGMTPGDLAQVFAQHYGISLEQAQKDVDATSKAIEAEHWPPLSPRPAGLKSVFLTLTEACNLACLHCYAYQAQPRYMERDLVFSILTQALDLGCSQFTFSGGEPLLYPHLKDLIALIQGRASIRVLTNSLLLSPKWVAFFQDIENLHVQISIEAADAPNHDAIRGKGSHQGVIRAVEKVHKAGIPFSLSVTVQGQPMESLLALPPLATQMGATKLRIIPLRSKGRGKDFKDQMARIRDIHTQWILALRSQSSQHTGVQVEDGLGAWDLSPVQCHPWCPIGQQLAFDVDGSAYPCVLLRDPAHRVGSLQSQSLRDIIEGPALRNYAETVLRRREEIPSCASCWWKNLCQGGCMGQAFEEQGDLWQPDEFCTLRKSLYQEAFRRILSSGFERPASA